MRSAVYRSVCAFVLRYWDVAICSWISRRKLPKEPILWTFLVRSSAEHFWRFLAGNCGLALGSIKWFPKSREGDWSKFFICASSDLALLDRLDSRGRPKTLAAVIQLQ